MEFFETFGTPTIIYYGLSLAIVIQSIISRLVLIVLADYIPF